MIKYILLLTCIAFTSVGQKIPYTISNGLQIQGVDATNPLIYDNDMVNDTPDIFYLWLKANRKEVNLVGNINTRDLHPGALARDHNVTFDTWSKFYNAYTSVGMKNVPAPIKGSSRSFNSTSIETSAGSDLIISEAKKASSAKPLVIILGGQATSVANAFAKDRSIGPNIIVFHVDGYGQTGYNAVDDKACLELIKGGVKYINWSGDLYSWYNKAGSPGYSASNKMPGITLVGMPSNAFSNELRNNWFNQAFASWGDIGDAPPIFYFFNHGLWENVVRKTIANQTVTTEAYDYLLVSKNKWADYGPMLNSYVVNAANYIPATTTPPVEPPPTTVTQTPYKNFSIPGKIEAEDFDNGGEGVAYHDVDVLNAGGKYRTTGVDIEGTTLLNVGWTNDGEWLEYTANVTATGKYKVEFLVSSPVSTASINLQENNTTLGTISVPNTAGWQTYKPVSFESDLTAGTKVFRLNILKGDVNIDNITFTSVTGVPPVEPPVPPLPGSNLNTYNVLAYGATGLGGTTDDRAAIQAAIDAAIKTSGKVIIPSPINYYRINNTLFIKPTAPESQAYISIEGNGKYWQQIVYQGPSNNPAVVIVGLKAGSSIKGMHVKLGDGVSGSACFDIGTSQLSTSTSGFSFENCTAELNRGVGNVGFRIGKIDELNGSDISQVDWRNITVFGPYARISGQIGFHFAGHNSLGFNINSSGVVFCETGIKVTAGGVITLVGYLTSQNGTELYTTHSTQIAFFGGRFESSQRFLRVDPSANFTGININGALISDFKTQNIFDFQGNGGLMLENVKIESPFDFGPTMFTLGNGVGALSIRGGAINATDNFVTSGGWRVKVENVVKLNRDYQAVGFLPNK